MNALDFVGIELAARKLHDEEVRRIFGRLTRALSEAIHHVLHGLQPGHPHGQPKRFA
jgi:hypothetical protein